MFCDYVYVKKRIQHEKIERRFLTPLCIEIDFSERLNLHCAVIGHDLFY